MSDETGQLVTRSRHDARLITRLTKSIWNLARRNACAGHGETQRISRYRNTDDIELDVLR